METAGSGKKAHKPHFSIIPSPRTCEIGVPLEGDEKKSLKKMFPNLMRELETGENKVAIDSANENCEETEESLLDEETLPEESLPEEKLPDKFRNYCPDVVDFLRRCDTEHQAEEIVAYLQKRGELTAEKADEIRAQLKKEGLRSFGPKKEDNYYFKQSGIC